MKTHIAIGMVCGVISFFVCEKIDDYRYKKLREKTQKVDFEDALKRIDEAIEKGRNKHVDHSIPNPHRFDFLPYVE